MQSVHCSNDGEIVIGFGLQGVSGSAEVVEPETGAARAAIGHESERSEDAVGGDLGRGSGNEVSSDAEGADGESVGSGSRIVAADQGDSGSGGKSSGLIGSGGDESSCAF